MMIFDIDTAVRIGGVSRGQDRAVMYQNRNHESGNHGVEEYARDDA